MVESAAILRFQERACRIMIHAHPYKNAMITIVILIMIRTITTHFLAYGKMHGLHTVRRFNFPFPSIRIPWHDPVKRQNWGVF